MKKNKTLSLALIITMLLLPFTNIVDVSGAPPPSYVGVSEGDIITWEVEFDGSGLTDFATDIDTTATRIMNFIADDTSTGLEDYIEQWIPNSMLNQNLTAGICELLENITSGSILPEGWVDMGVPQIVTDMINASIPPGILPDGWLDTINCTDFICSLLELAFGGLPNWNQTWTGFNVTAILDLIFETVVDPTGYFEAGWLDSYNLIEMFDILLLNLSRAFENVSFLNGWTDFNFSRLILTALENITAPVMPAGWLDMDIKTTINAMLDTGLLTSACMDLNISECIKYIIENVTSGVMPAGWMDLSLSEIMDNSLTLLASVADPELVEL